VSSQPRVVDSSTRLASVESVATLPWGLPDSTDRSSTFLEESEYEQRAALGLEFSRRRVYGVAKRAMDLVVAGLLLVVTLPILFAAMLAIRLTSPGPVVFAQWRLGKGRVPFLCYKLRTMVDGAERLLRSDHELQEEFYEIWKLPGDPRVTAVGRFLRRTSIDELPQLINVLRGEMSMVGPRPVQLSEAHYLYGARTAVVLSHKPGLTGMWQVSGRSSTSYHERAELDLRYVASQSLWLDVILLLRTIPAVLAGRDAV
jgi:exopolysaccharide production protein ExoY